MLNKTPYKFLTVIFLLIASAPGYAQEDEALKTLFTTAQERELINANRYKTTDKTPRKQNTTAETVAVRGLVKEQITQSYRISGISITADGSRMAWVNDKAYENGATMDDGVKIRINNAAVKSVTIITPDGLNHTGTSGETIEVSYVRAGEE